MSAPTTTPEDRVAVYVVSGTDSVLVDRGLDRLLAELTSHHLDGAENQGPAGRGEQPAVATPAVAIEEHRAPSGDEDLLLGPVIDALFTPPFLADRRLVVLRDAERLDASQASELASRHRRAVLPQRPRAGRGRQSAADRTRQGGQGTQGSGQGDRHLAGLFRQGTHAMGG